MTPSFNQARFLEETIRSVLLQDYPNLEYLIIDGGSTDGSVEIIRKYEPRLAYWVSEPDRGQSEAINKGWTRATGQVLTYLNSDDLYLPKAISAAVDHLHRNPTVGVAYGSTRIIDIGGNVLTPMLTPADWTPEAFVAGLPAPSMFFRRDVLTQVGFMDEGLRFAMDIELCHRVALAGFWFSRIPGSPTVCVREWSGAKSSNWSDAEVEEVWGVMDRLISNQRTPAALRPRIKWIKAQVCLRPAYQNFLIGNMKEARRFLRKSLETHWPMAASGEFLRLSVGTLLGRRGSRLARSVRGWW